MLMNLTNQDLYEKFSFTAGADREEVRAEASAVDADIKEAQSDDTQKLLPDEVQKAGEY